MRSQAHIRQYKKLRRRRRLSRGLWTLGFVLFGLGLLYLFSGWMLGPLIQRYLERQTGAAVYIDSAYWIGPATVRLENVIFAADPNRLSETSIVQVGRVDCSLAPADLFRLRLRVRSVTAQEALIQVRYDQDLARWNFSSLAFMNEPREPSRVPVFFLDNALLRVQIFQDNRLQTLTSVGLKGQILSEDKGRQYRFSLVATQEAAMYGSRIDGVWKRGQGQGQVTLVGQVRMPLTYIYGNAWNLQQIRLDCRYQKEWMSINHFSCQMGSGRMELQGNLIGPAGHRILDLHAQVDNLSLTPTSRPDALVYSESVLQMLDPGLQRFLRRFRPEGSADAHLRIQGRLADLAQSEITGMILCRDIAILDQKFPYRLEKLTGTIELTGKNLILHDLQARHGPSVFVIGGGVENMGPQARISIRLTSEDLRLTEDVKRAMPERLQQKWFEFAPAGTCAIQYDHLRRPDQSKQHRLTVNLLDAACTYDRYPYPLTRLTGTIVFDPNAVEFKNVVSCPAADQQITIDGTIRRIRTPAPLCDLWIRTRRLALDQTFRKTFRKSQRQVLEDFVSDGRMDLDMHIQGIYSEQQPVPYEAAFSIQADSMNWKRFPLPLREARLRGSFTPEMLDVESFTARYGQAQCRVSGQILRTGNEPARPGGTLSFSAEDLSLDPSFWQAVQAAQIYPGLFSKIRAEGTVDLDGRISFNVPQTPEVGQRLTIRFKEGALCSAQSNWKSGPAAGTIHVQDSHIRLQDFTLRQVPVNESFFDLLAGAKDGAFSALHPAAVLDVDLDRLAWNTDPQNPQFDGQGRIDIHQGCIPNLSVEQIEGFWQGRIAWEKGPGSVQGSGQFGASAFRVLGRSVTDLTGSWKADPNSGLILCEEVAARCHQGRLFGKLRVDTRTPLTPYRAEATFENIHLNPFLLNGRPQEQNEQLAEGRLRGSMDLDGRLRQYEHSRGRIHLEAVDLKLGRESLFGKALSMMQFRRPSDYVFTEMLIEALLDKGVLTSERILLAGDRAVYQGKGKLDLADRSIRMELTAFGRRKDQEPTLLTALAENLGAALAKVEISGTLDQPVITQVPLPILSRPFGLFGAPNGP